MIRPMQGEAEFTGLDPASPGDVELLRDLQAGILHSHGRNHVNLAFLRFRGRFSDPSAIRAELALLPVTSAAEQISAARRYKEKGERSQPFISFFLSASGYRALGVPCSRMPRDPAFREGMRRASVHRLGDPRMSKWAAEFKEVVDALLLVATDDQVELETKTEELLDAISRAAGPNCLVNLERGSVMRDSESRVVEPFGFADGLSQPLFFKSQIAAAFNAGGGKRIWDPSGDPNRLILAADPSAAGARGSYLVYRKLAQDVSGFKAHLARLSSWLSLEEETAAALVVGRTRAGNHLMGICQSADGNDFDFSDDPDGERCPLHAHIRKTNPRDDEPATRFRRIARRGIPFKTEAADGTEQGLHFLCFQQDIERQFEFIQGRWAGNPKFPERPWPVGVDALIGHQRRPSTPQRWPHPKGGTRRFAFADFVRFLGGEYFFAPSTRGLKELC